jgi:hypothetical protein
VLHLTRSGKDDDLAPASRFTASPPGETRKREKRGKRRKAAGDGARRQERERGDRGNGNGTPHNSFAPHPPAALGWPLPLAALASERKTTHSTGDRTRREENNRW